MDAYPFEMLHPACGKPALRAAVRPEPGMKLFESGLARLAGTPYQLGHRLMCGTCGQALQITDFAPDNFFERKTGATP